MTLHKAQKHEYDTVKKLYNSAFPSNERAPFFMIKNRAVKDRATMLIAQDGGDFVGFAYTVCYRDLVYLFYFAVAEDKRGSGNGSKILALLKDYYKGRNIFLAREPLDENADNRKQRIDRRNFYIRNGFVDLPCQIREAGVIYDLMSTGADIKAEDYNALIVGWSGKFIARIVKMEFVVPQLQKSRRG